MSLSKWGMTRCRLASGHLPFTQVVQEVFHHRAELCHHASTHLGRTRSRTSEELCAGTSGLRGRESHRVARASHGDVRASGHGAYVLNQE